VKNKFADSNVSLSKCSGLQGEQATNDLYLTLPDTSSAHIGKRSAQIRQISVIRGLCFGTASEVWTTDHADLTDLRGHHALTREESVTTQLEKVGWSSPVVCICLAH
jgi:hypothetical protein